jgi:ribosomal protein L10
MKSISRFLFSTSNVSPTKLSHVRLNFKEFNQKLPLIKQNVINRKALSYANADLVNHLYEEYRTLKFDID